MALVSFKRVSGSKHNLFTIVELGDGERITLNIPPSAFPDLRLWREGQCMDIVKDPAAVQQCYESETGPFAPDFAEAPEDHLVEAPVLG